MTRPSLGWGLIGGLLITVVTTREAQAAGERPDAIRFETGRFETGAPSSSPAAKGPVRLRGPEARYQLLVTGHFPGAEFVDRDVTREVSFEAAPAGRVEISATGLLTPIHDGEVTVSARLRGQPELEARVELRVEGVDKEEPIHFPGEIVPLFTKLGCNGGGCHGKSGGQNGFRLSLLGFYPEEDYEFLIKESRGRRISMTAPDRSLLLLKATNLLPHGGGQRLERGSHEYRLLHRWMRQGLPWGDRDAPKVERLEVFPEVRRLERKAHQQLQVLAWYSDGGVEDVTHVATYESNDTELLEIAPDGRVETKELSGQAAVMVRYRELVGVFRGIVPLGVDVGELPPTRNFIDEHVFAKWKDLGIPPSLPADDMTFLRRAYLDIAGRLPRLEEVQAYEAESASERRERLVDRLVDSNDYATFFANKWGSILRNRREKANYARGNFAFHAWLRDSLHQNVPYDDIVRDILAASGDIASNPPVAWYRAVRSVEQQVEDSAQLFLGLRIQCARCHHHPFEVWSQRDYYGYSAFFTRVGRKGNREGRSEEEVVFHNPGLASARNPRSNETLRPMGLGSEGLALDPETDPRQALVDWMAREENPFFARALVNRYWKHFFGRGLVEPEDDLRVTNPATHPELLDALAKSFTESGYNLKTLVRIIAKSTVYGLSSIPNEHNAGDRQTYSRFYPRRLNAEVLYDALHEVTGTQASFGGFPDGTRAVELPDASTANYFLTVFGRPQGESSCECERSNDASLAQSLHLLNSKDVLGKVASDQGRAAKLAADERSLEERIQELYLRAFGRAAEEEEVAIARAHVEAKGQEPAGRRAAFEDIVWALLNTKEFLFNH